MCDCLRDYSCDLLMCDFSCDLLMCDCSGCLQAALGIMERFGGGMGRVEEHAHVGTVRVRSSYRSHAQFTLPLCYRDKLPLKIDVVAGVGGAARRRGSLVSAGADAASWRMPTIVRLPLLPPRALQNCSRQHAAWRTWQLWPTQ